VFGLCVSSGSVGDVVDDRAVVEVAPADVLAGAGATDGVVDELPPPVGVSAAVDVAGVSASDPAPAAAGELVGSGAAIVVATGGPGEADTVGATGCDVVGVVVGDGFDGVPQSARFSGFGGSPGMGAGGSYPGGGVSTAMRSSANDHPSTEPGGGARLPAPTVL
jgi:hypothetical protein